MDFRKNFQTYTNMQLLKIIENPNDYQSTAVETAKALIDERRLTSEEVLTAKNELEIEKQNDLKKDNRPRELEAKMINVGKSILENTNFIQEQSPTTEKTIKSISVLFAGLFIFQLYKQFDLIVWLFADGVQKWDLSVAAFILPLLVIPTGTVLFYKKHTLGWLLLTVLLTYTAVSAIGYLILTIKSNRQHNPAFDNLLPYTSEATQLLTLLFFGGIIWAMCKQNVRAVYSINQLTMTLSLVLTTLLVSLGFAIIFF